MQPQFSEEEDRKLPSEEEEYSLPIGVRQLMHKLLQYPQMQVFLVILGIVLLAAIIQNGLMGPLLLSVVVGAVVFLTGRHLAMEDHAQQMEALVIQEDRLAQERRAKRQRFARIKARDDLLLLTPPEFEQMVGEVMKRLGYQQVQVVGKSRDLCVDIQALGPNGEKVAVQCKRYAKRNVNSDEMQKFIGMIYVHHRANKGMYFTTSSYTKDARRLGEDNRIEVIDGVGLVKIIRTLARDRV